MLNDYKGLKLIASSNPHIRNNEDTRSIMLDVIIALCPALIMSVIRFGFRALISVLVSVVSAMFFEWLYRKLMHKTQTLGDLSAAVTGVLLAFVCPVTLPYWMLIVGNFFAIFLVKQLYGGLGKNFLNPALAGRAALVACYTSQMTSWIDPASGKAPLFGGADVVTAATPLAMMKGGEFAEVTAQYSLSDMFIGNIGGSLGEISAMMLLIGGLYLIFRKVISWQIPVAYIGTVAVLTLASPPGQRRDELDALQRARRRPVPRRVLYGHRLCHLPRHKEGPADLRHRLRSADGVHPPLRLLSRGRLLFHPVMNCCTWMLDKYTKPTLYRRSIRKQRRRRQRNEDRR